MITSQTSNILQWLKNRLEIKYKDHSCSEVLSKLSIYFSDNKYNDEIITEVCNKVFIGFANPDKDLSSMFDVGYTKKEKEQIFSNVKNIIDEYHRVILKL